MTEKSPELIAAELEHEKQRLAYEETILLSDPHAALGKAISDAIQKAKREFIKEWETIPTAVIMHPADFRDIQYYAVRREMFTYMYVKQGEANCIPNDPSLRALILYSWERGTFLVTTLKSLGRSGVMASVLTDPV